MAKRTSIVARVAKFSVPSVGVSVLDLRSTGDARAIVARDTFTSVLIRNMARQGRGAELCGPQKQDERGDGGHREVSLVVTQPGRVLGMLVLYACTVERNRDDFGDITVQMRAMPAPGMRKAEGHTGPATAAAVMRYVLENDLPLENGRTLDVVQYDFPGFAKELWTGDPISAAVLGDIEGRGHPISRRADGSPRNTRRKDAPEETAIERR